MSAIGWQDLIAAALAVAAVVYLLRRRRVKRQPKPTLVGLARAPKRTDPRP